eukprot:CAMPEP_0117568398 /NCGR_PEP_ID=MMETSP0784-20121206/58113_1 /TAXON_ID=39447 /ORGANISM="" /LENGTH=44 /DNA_ID= /DNA_START= /DNA_END= /DNA_ORIENTATION=
MVAKAFSLPGTGVCGSTSQGMTREPFSSRVAADWVRRRATAAKP